MGSTRLPNKVLMPVLGKPLLGWMFDRVSSCKEIDEIVIATTKDGLDDVIEEFARSINCQVYRGSEEDVLDRYYQAACLVNGDIIVRITADCPLLDHRILSNMIQNFAVSDLDFLSNSEPLPSSWPDGMDVSVISFKALHKAWQKAIKPSDREHVTFYFWNNISSFRCKRVEHYPDLSKYRITIDYQEDFDLIKAVIEHFGSIDPTMVNIVSMEEILIFLDENLDIFQLNEKYKRGLGWQTSLQRDRELGY